MLETQAERLIERLKSACTYHRFDEPRVHAEYIRFLMRHDFERMDEAIDLALEEESRNVPAISLISKKYHEINERPRRKADVQNQEYCAVCDDKGFILMTKYIKTVMNSFHTSTSCIALSVQLAGPMRSMGHSARRKYRTKCRR